MAIRRIAGGAGMEWPSSRRIAGRAGMEWPSIRRIAGGAGMTLNQFPQVLYQFNLWNGPVLEDSRGRWNGMAQ